MQSKEVIIHKLTERITQLKPEVTAEDRRKAAKELEIDIMTVMRYLQGHVKKVDTGTKLLKFLQTRIKERNEILA
jgi:hypothetical protein